MVSVMPLIAQKWLLFKDAAFDVVDISCNSSENDFLGFNNED